MCARLRWQGAPARHAIVKEKTTVVLKYAPCDEARTDSGVDGVEVDEASARQLFIQLAVRRCHSVLRTDVQVGDARILTCT